MLQRTAGGLECPGQIFQNVLGLQLDVGAVERKLWSELTEVTCIDIPSQAIYRAKLTGKKSDILGIIEISPKDQIIKSYILINTLMTSTVFYRAIIVTPLISHVKPIP
jgi:hypothetical protein